MFICVAGILQGSPPNTPVAKEVAKVSPDPKVSNSSTTVSMFLKYLY